MESIDRLKDLMVQYLKADDQRSTFEATLKLELACNPTTINEILIYIDEQRQLIRGYVDDKKELEERVLDQKKEIDDLKEDLQFVERWANHHGRKPNYTPEQILGFIQHYPGIKEITDSYDDGIIPDTFDPYAEIEKLKVDAVRLDYLSKAYSNIFCLGGTWYSRRAPGTPLHKRKNLRESIDAIRLTDTP